MPVHSFATTERNAQKHNFRVGGVQEEMVVVPLMVRIAGYEPSTVPGYECYPTIVVEGEMGGGSWEFDHGHRRIYGTVGIIADGSVRWSLVNCIPFTSYQHLKFRHSIRPLKTTMTRTSGFLKAYRWVGSAPVLACSAFGLALTITRRIL